MVGGGGESALAFNDARCRKNDRRLTTPWCRRAREGLFLAGRGQTHPLSLALLGEESSRKQ